MKNLFVLPTDKQSVLYKLNKFDDEFFLKRDLKNVLNPLYLFYNIYITSYNQDINENDYIITKDGKLVQVSYLLSEDLQGASKVILTTDQKLINDDVQAIPDEFLKWFIKNPSCEEVGVKNPLIANISDFGYKIVIPKEEVFEMYKNLYGKSVKMNDRFETEHIWSEELALINKGRWIPKEVIETANLEKEMFDLEQQLDIPSNLRWHNSKPKKETLLGKTISKKDADKDSFEDVNKYKTERSYSDEDMIRFANLYSDIDINESHLKYFNGLPKFKK